MSYILQPKYKDELDALMLQLSEEDTALIETINKLNETVSAIASSIGRINKLTPSDVSLSFVPNWAPATVETVIKGTDPNAFVSPKRLDQYMDANLYDPLADIFDTAAANLS